MAQQPRGRPPSQAPPPDRGRNALTLLGGGVLVLAVAGGAWAAFGRDGEQTTDATAKPSAVLGPAVPGTTPRATPKASAAVKPTSIKPVAATPAATKAATTAPTVKPTAAVVATVRPTASQAPAPVATPSKAPTVVPSPAPVTKPPVTAPQQQGTVAAKDYTFRVARGDTLWGFAKEALAATGRSTSNAAVADFVAKLYQSNKGTVGSNPDLILPGQTIVWPAGL